MKTLEDVMTREVEVLHPRMTLRHAAEAMRRLDAGSLPVCEEGRLVGWVTDRDLVVRGVAMGHDLDHSQVSLVMNEDVEGFAPGTSLEDATRALQDSAVQELLVVDEHRQLLGRVSRSVLIPEVAHPPTARELEEFFGSGTSLH
jgi:CBS domain-containing protein